MKERNQLLYIILDGSVHPPAEVAKHIPSKDGKTNNVTPTDNFKDQSPRRGVYLVKYGK